MSLQDTLDKALKDAMRARNQAVISCIRQIKAKVQEASNATDFKGEVDDVLIVRVIGSYVKSLDKAINEMGTGSERADALVASYGAEIKYLEQYLPKQMSDDALLRLVNDAIKQAKLSDKKDAGRVVGLLMKSHRGQFDATRAKGMAEAQLGHGPAE